MGLLIAEADSSSGILRPLTSIMFAPGHFWQSCTVNENKRLDHSHPIHACQQKSLLENLCSRGGSPCNE